MALQGHTSIARFCVALALLCAMIVMPSSARANPKYASFVIDADTGMVLHQRHANKVLHPASLTKVMTLMLLFDKLETGQMRMNDRIYISSYAASMVPSKLGLKPGSYIRVRDAIPALMIKSANDVAVAVAEHLGGSERRFAALMNRRAKELGMSRTRFINASGLHHDRQVSTARDMARMARHVIKAYPNYYKMFARKQFTYQGTTYRSHNRLMNSYSGMDGMKTGYINASGFNLIASAVRDNRRLIGIVFGGRTSRSRNAHMANLLNRSFAKLPSVRTASAKIPPPGRKPQVTLQLASLNNIIPNAGTALPQQPSRWAPLNPGTLLIGEGDYDEELTQRAQNAVQVGNLGRAPIQQNPIAQGALKDNANWAIQVGAFRTQRKGKSALKTALQDLPQYYANATPTLVPLRASGRKIYRARLSGYTPQDAYAACAYIKECITIAP